MGLLYCKRNFVRFLDGRRYHVRRGDIVHDTDPVVVGSEACFDKVDDLVKCFAHNVAESPVVEEATANPGEKRVTRGRPPKKAKSEPTPEPVKPEPKPVVEESARDEKEESKDDA